jgi:ElaB/YqjD/DUF883 family membrane-anchored ribosome-binding protein
MGKRSDELQREIADYRGRLDAKVNRLDERVRSDLRDSRETVDRDVRERLQLDKYAEERPFLTLATAFGAGILLGSVTPSIPTPSMPSMSSRDGRGPSRNSGGNESGTGGSGFLSTIVGSASGALSGTIEEEVRQLFSQVTGGREKSSDEGSRRNIDRHEDRDDGDSSEREVTGAHRAGSDG